MSINKNIFPIFTDIGGYYSELKGISLQRYTQNDFSSAKTGTLFFNESDKRLYIKKDTYGSVEQSNKIAYLSDIQNSGGGSSTPLPIPNKTLFVAPNFNNTNKHYSSLTQAYNNASSGDTIVVYTGSYQFPTNISKNITFNCVGDVTFTTNSHITISSKCSIFGNVDIKFGNENSSSSNSGYKVTLSNSYFTVKCKLFIAYCIFQQNNSIVIIDADIFYSNIEFTQSNYPMYLELTARRIGNGMSVSQYAPHIANPYFVFRNCNFNSHARIMGLNNNSILTYYGNNINGLDIKKVNLSYTNSASYGSLPPY